jgi:hypothetical protein
MKKSPSVVSPCAKIVLFFSNGIIDLPLPIVERKVCGLK